MHGVQLILGHLEVLNFCKRISLIPFQLHMFFFRKYIVQVKFVFLDRIWKTSTLLIISSIGYILGMPQTADPKCSIKMVFFKILHNCEKIAKFRKFAGASLLMNLEA